MERAETNQSAGSVESVAPVNRPRPNRSGPVIHHERHVVVVASRHGGHRVLAPAGATPLWIELAKRLPDRMDDLGRNDNGVHRGRRR